LADVRNPFLGGRAKGCCAHKLEKVLNVADDTCYFPIVSLAYSQVPCESPMEPLQLATWCPR